MTHPSNDNNTKKSLPRIPKKRVPWGDHVLRGQKRRTSARPEKGQRHASTNNNTQRGASHA
jgi:hypothetical protein